MKKRLLSAALCLCMMLTLLPTAVLAEGSTEQMSFNTAILHDTSGTYPDDELYDAGSYQLTMSMETGGYSISVHNLKQHQNGENGMGYWAGMAVIAPAKATQMKVAVSSESTPSLEGVRATALEERVSVDEEGTAYDGVALYADTANVTTLYCKVQWLDGEGHVVTDTNQTGTDEVYSLTVDFSGVTHYQEPAVAQVNGKTYPTIQAALDAAGENDVVTLLSRYQFSPFEDELPLKITKDVTIKGNGDATKLQGNAEAGFFVLDANLTLDNVTARINQSGWGKGTGIIFNEQAEGDVTLTIQNKSNLIFSGLTCIDDRSSGHTKVVVDDSTIQANPDVIVEGDPSDVEGSSTLSNGDEFVVQNGSQIEADWCRTAIQANRITIDASTVNFDNNFAAAIKTKGEDASVTISGGSKVTVSNSGSVLPFTNSYTEEQTNAVVELGQDTNSSVAKMTVEAGSSLQLTNNKDKNGADANFVYLNGNATLDNAGPYVAVKTAPPTTEGLYRILYTVNGNVYWTDLVTAAEGVLTYKEPAAPSVSGHTFGGWEYGSVDVTGSDEETGKVSFTPGEAKEYTFSAKLTSNGGSSSGGSTSSSTTKTTTNPDGSTTTTVTRPDGSKTATTQYPDGSAQVVETGKDGTVTTTTTDSTGNKTETVANTDGSTKTTVAKADGSGSATTVSASGQMETQVTLSRSVVDSAAESGAAVALPMPSVPVTTQRESAPTVTVTLPSGSSAKVEIPVENVTAGTVAVIVHEDGTEEVIKTTVQTENGIAVTLHSGDTIKVVDNAAAFEDVSSSFWGADAIAFATSRELFNGTGETTFSPNGDMSRAMIVTVLARLEGVDTSTGATWDEVGCKWAVEKGISDGANMSGSLTREQLATMLYRYAGEPAVSGSDLSAYSDAAFISDYARQAMAWAVSEGIISGNTPTTLNPNGKATRAEVATMLMRFCENIAK